MIGGSVVAKKDEDYNAKSSAEIQKLMDELVTQKQKHEQELSTNKAYYEKQLADQKAFYEKKIADIEERHRLEIKDLKDKGEIQITEARHQNEKQMEILNGQADQLKQSLENERLNNEILKTQMEFNQLNQTIELANIRLGQAAN